MTDEKKDPKKEQNSTENEDLTQERPADQKPTAEPEKPTEGKSKPEVLTSESKSQTEDIREKSVQVPEISPKKTVETPKPVTQAPKPEEKPTEPTKLEPRPKPTGKFKDLIKDIESLSVLELAELVKELENRFGVSASAMTIAQTPSAGAQPATSESTAEEKTQFTVVLTDSGTQKINVIKAIREINPDLGLKEAKDIADAPPKEIKKDVNKEEAESAKKKLEEAGAKVELK